MNNTQFSAKKIAKGFVKANINIWGGATAPYLNNLTNVLFDPKVFFDQFKIPATQQTRIKRSQKTLQECVQEEVTLNSKLCNYMGTYRTLIIQIQSVSMNLQYASSRNTVRVFSNSVAYQINRSFFPTNTNGMYNNVRFYNINGSLRNSPELKIYVTCYNKIVESLKKLERDILNTKAKLNAVKRKELTAQREYQRIMNELGRP